MDALVTPFHFDGHGVNDATGQRIAKVSVGETWQDREPVGKLLSAAPELRDLLAAAVARVKLANEEGDMILSAWLPDAEALLAKLPKV